MVWLGVASSEQTSAEPHPPLLLVVVVPSRVDGSQSGSQVGDESSHLSTRSSERVQVLMLSQETMRKRRE